VEFAQQLSHFLTVRPPCGFLFLVEANEYEPQYLKGRTSKPFEAWTAINGRPEAPTRDLANKRVELFDS
jgi:hypothetical protein